MCICMTLFASLCLSPSKHSLHSFTCHCKRCKLKYMTLPLQTSISKQSDANVDGEANADADSAAKQLPVTTSASAAAAAANCVRAFCTIVFWPALSLLFAFLLLDFGHGFCFAVRVASIIFRVALILLLLRRSYVSRTATSKARQNVHKLKNKSSNRFIWQHQIKAINKIQNDNCSN